MEFDYCKKLARDLNIEPDELETALWYLHHGLGTILYFPKEGLKDTVFCKLQAIYESVTELIAKTYTIDNVQHDSSLDEFKNLGIFSLEEIGSEVHDSPIPRRLLIQLLEKLNIVTSVPPELSLTRIKNPFFMPCKLQISREPIDIPEGNPEPLMLHFSECGFTPIGVFPALITKMFSQLKDLDWEIAKEGPNKDRFYKNRVRFCIKKDAVYLMSHLRFIEIAIQCDDPFRTGTAYYFRDVIEKALTEVTMSLGYGILGDHQYAFLCQSPKCASNEKKHLAVFKKVNSAYMTCINDMSVKSDLNAHQRVWFSSESKLNQ